MTLERFLCGHLLLALKATYGWLPIEIFAQVKVISIHSERLFARITNPKESYLCKKLLVTIREEVARIRNYFPKEVIAENNFKST